MLRRGSKISITEANYFFLIIGLALLLIGSYVQSKEIYTGLLITEYLIILMPTVLYIKLRGNSLKKVLRLNKISIKQGLLIPLIVLFSYPIGIFLNLLMIIVLSAFGKVMTNPVPIPESGGEFIIGIIVIALSAGICEEVMFRGLMMKAYEKMGKWKAIIISACLFGFFHFNIQNLIGPIFLGIVFGYMVYKTNSLFSAIIAHATNNGLALTLGYLLTRLPAFDDQLATDAAEMAEGMSQTTTLLIGAIGIGIVAVATGAVAFGLLWILPKTKVSEVSYNNDFEKESENPFLLLLPLILFAGLFIFVTYKVLSMV